MSEADNIKFGLWVIAAALLLLCVVLWKLPSGERWPLTKLLAGGFIAVLLGGLVALLQSAASGL